MTIHVDETTGLIERPAPAPFPVGPPSVAAVLEAVLAEEPDRPAILDGGRRWTYRELDAEVAHAAGALLEIGAGSGELVAWSLPNCAELVIGFLATARIGAVWVGADPRLAAAEREAILDAAGATVQVCHLDDWLKSVAAATLSPAAPMIDPHAPAAIGFTSGTTGTPKGVVHSQHNLLWPGLVTLDNEPPHPADRTGTPLALTNLNIMVLGPLTALLRGGTAVILGSTDATRFAKDVATTRLTRTLLVPTLVHDLLASSVEAPSLESLTTVLIGGAGTPPAVRREFALRFGVMPVLSYGLSEAPTGVARTGADSSAGATPLPPIEILIVDPDDEPVDPGTEGEICLRPTIEGRWARSWSPTLGYWREPAATRELLRGGALHTGDLGVLDESGRLRVTGRSDDVIVRGATNIHPSEIEQALLDHEAVTSAAVVGLPDTRLGQVVVAVVSVSARVGVATLQDHCKSRLSAHKVPAAIAIVTALPTNPGGKVQRDELRQIASEALAAADRSGCRGA